MSDSLAVARGAIRSASAVSPRLGGQVTLAAFSDAGRPMPVRPDDAATHDSARRGTVVVRDMELVTYRWGHGDDTVLLVHGWRGRASQFSPLVRELVHEGFHVVSFDAPAHGDSPGRRTDIRDWLAAIQGLQAMHGRFRAIIGHSFGGLAALTAARDGVTTASVATIAGAGTPAAFLAEFGDAMALDEPTRAAFEAAFRRRIGESASSLERRYDAIAHPLADGIDLLIAHDEQDRQLRPEWSQRLFETHSERARLVTTSGFGHARILAADPVLDAIVGLVSEGLAGVDRARRSVIAASPADALLPDAELSPRVAGF
jgi:pimeloyl-ACP methyl ester carboxylesterase